MANQSMIEQEIRNYLEESDNLSRADRYVHLKAIFDKHLAMEKTEHLLTMSDFHHIVSTAKQNFVHLTLPMTISNRELYPSDAPNVALTESVISYLNKAGILRKLVKIDVTTKTSK
jgi:hypothetical protein